MIIFAIATDVLRELFASRYMLVLFGFIVLGLLGLTFALDLEVVDGALAASRLFGAKVEGAIIPVDVALRPIFQGLVFATFYFGILFGVIATADIAPRMLAPGRVELLLSLPVKRWELVVGTYLGVACLSIIGTTFAVGGVSAILFIKAEWVTAAPAVGAVGAVAGFLSLYGVMLAVAALTGSTTLSAGSAILLYIGSLATSDRVGFLSWFKDGPLRTAISILVAPLPRLKTIADQGADAVTGDRIPWEVIVPLLGGALAFGAFGVVVAAAVVSAKDY